MHFDRRSFLSHSLQIAGAAMLNQRLLAQNPDSAVRSGAFASMTWMNEPASWNISGTKLVVKSRPKTDFWRKTLCGCITDNGHFFHQPASGDFTLQACIDGKYASSYDQAGLMVRLDAENWMKCGTEFDDGQRHAGVVFTRDFSDGSTMPDLSQTAPVWWRVVRKKDSIETLCSLDGKSFVSVRLGHFVPNAKVEVGIMCSAPEGPGFESTFSDLKLEVG
jgi:hypothetical protein